MRQGAYRHTAAQLGVGSARPEQPAARSDSQRRQARATGRRARHEVQRPALSTADYGAQAAAGAVDSFAFGIGSERSRNGSKHSERKAHAWQRMQLII